MTVSRRQATITISSVGSNLTMSAWKSKSMKTKVPQAVIFSQENNGLHGHPFFAKLLEPQSFFELCRVRAFSSRGSLSGDGLLGRHAHRGQRGGPQPYRALPLLRQPLRAPLPGAFRCTLPPTNMAPDRGSLQEEIHLPGTSP